MSNVILTIIVCAFYLKINIHILSIYCEIKTYNLL